MYPHTEPASQTIASLLASLPRILPLLQNPLFYQLLRLRPALQLLLQTILPHMLLQFLLLTLERWCGARVGKDVACSFVARVS